MSQVFTFDLDAVIEAVTAAKRLDPPACFEIANEHPGLMLCADDGVYLMTSGAQHVIWSREAPKFSGRHAVAPEIIECAFAMRAIAVSALVQKPADTFQVTLTDTQVIVDCVWTGIEEEEEEEA